MPTFNLRKFIAATHLWLGLAGGLFVAVLAASGAVVTFRPQIATLLSPAASTRTHCVDVDWNRAEQDIAAAGGGALNRIYAPSGSDTRYHIRVRTGVDAIYTHVIYDACAGAVLGTVPMGWMDWIVDFHHNFLAERTGRQFVGIAGIALLLSGVGGLLLLLLSRPGLRRLMRVQLTGDARRTTFDVHRFTGAASVLLLLIQAFTGVWLCFPQPLRATVALVAKLDDEARPPRGGRGQGGRAGLGDVIHAAQQAIPDGSIREIRLPDGYGNVQVRMRREGDFRSLGNNVVTVDGATAHVQAVDLYEGKAGGTRFIQAMSGLHYAEWGGLTYRFVYGVAGLGSVLLSATGAAYWWLRSRRRSPVARAVGAKAPARVTEAG